MTKFRVLFTFANFTDERGWAEEALEIGDWKLFEIWDLEFEICRLK